MFSIVGWLVARDPLARGFLRVKGPAVGPTRRLVAWSPRGCGPGRLASGGPRQNAKGAMTPPVGPIRRLVA